MAGAEVGSQTCLGEKGKGTHRAGSRILLMPSERGDKPQWRRKRPFLEYYSTIIKRNEIMPFAATWMDLEIIILSEVSQTEKDKRPMISLICGI